MQVLENIFRSSQPRCIISKCALTSDLLNDIDILLNKGTLFLIIHSGLYGPIPAMGSGLMATLHNIPSRIRIHFN